jgi:hypothetical protein
MVRRLKAVLQTMLAPKQMGGKPREADAGGIAPEGGKMQPQTLSGCGCRSDEAGAFWNTRRFGGAAVVEYSKPLTE